MIRIGLIGCGKIGSAIIQHIQEQEDADISFIQRRKPELIPGIHCTVINKPEESIYAETDLIIECATAELLKENFDLLISYCDVMPFSLTAFADPEFEKRAQDLCHRYHHKIYVPHGAIMGLDGILDGNRQWEKVTIETVKHPKSLGMQDRDRQIVHEGPTRNICSLFPKNVNVHAAIAMAGIGFDKTISRLIADPSVRTNTHRIILEALEMECTLSISSLADGGITSAYVPYSACGSLDRIQRKIWMQFV